MTTLNGRKTVCTPEIIKQVGDLISAGNSNVDASILSGIGKSTFYRWLQRGQVEKERTSVSTKLKIRKREQPFVDFWDYIQKAIPKRKAIWIGRIQKASVGGEEILETKEKYENIDGKQVLTERTITVKHRHAEWQATAWLLERLHYDEFGKRSRIDVYDWRKELKALWDTGNITREDVIDEIGSELASEFFVSEGITTIGPETTATENGSGQQE